MRTRRVQGPDWANLRRDRKLKLICISKTKGDNYRADVVDQYGMNYYHYLGDSEKRKLLKSGYVDTNMVYMVEDLVKNNKKLLKQLREEVVLG